MKCHLYYWHKDPLEAGEWFAATFPEKREWLRLQQIYNKALGTIRLEWLERWLEELKRLDAISDVDALIEEDNRVVCSKEMEWVL